MWWLPDAACIGTDPELFFPVGSSAPAQEQTSLARSVCGGCRVRTECLEWSLATCQDAGVWGGLDEEERRVIRRARRRATAASARSPIVLDVDEREDELAATG